MLEFKNLVKKKGDLCENSQYTGHFRYCIGTISNNTFFAMTPFFRCKDYMNEFFVAQARGADLESEIHGYEAEYFEQFDVDNMWLAFANTENPYHTSKSITNTHNLRSDLFSSMLGSYGLLDDRVEVNQVQQDEIVYLKPAKWATKSSISVSIWVSMVRAIYGLGYPVPLEQFKTDSVYMEIRNNFGSDASDAYLLKDLVSLNGIALVFEHEKLFPKQHLFVDPDLYFDDKWGKYTFHSGVGPRSFINTPMCAQAYWPKLAAKFKEFRKAA